MQNNLLILLVLFLFIVVVGLVFFNKRQVVDKGWSCINNSQCVQLEGGEYNTEIDCINNCPEVKEKEIVYVPTTSYYRPQSLYPAYFMRPGWRRGDGRRRRHRRDD